MSTLCCRTPRVLALAFAALVLAIVTQARADLVSDAAQFLQDYDELVALGSQIAADRDALKADIDNHDTLRADVLRFFADRLDAAATRLGKAADRKRMRIDLKFKGPKVQKPTKGTGVIAQDAAQYIASYNAWLGQRDMVQLDIAAMRTAVGNNDVTALTAAVTAFFTDSRARLEKRLQWQQDIRSMKKDVAFKPTGKAAPPPGTTLREHVQEFVNDRISWEAYAGLVDACRNNLAAAVGGGGSSIEDAVKSFLDARRSLHVKGVELALDRKAMRKDVGLGNGKEKERKSGAIAGTRDLDSGDEDASLDETPDTAGEK